MKEVFRPSQQFTQGSELTNANPSPRLGGEGIIFMFKDNQGETSRANDQDSGSQKDFLSSDQITAKWHTALTREEWRNPNIRSAIRAAVSLGLSPDTVTSRGKLETEAKEVIKNAPLSDSERFKKTEEILGRKLSQEQRDALLKAHHQGKVGIYSYSKERRKWNKGVAKEARILEEAGFTKDERRLLMEKGIAGETVAIDDDAWSDTLKAEMSVLNSILAPIPDEDLSDQMTELTDARRRIAALAGIPNVEKTEAMRRIQERINAIRQEDRRREEERQRQRGEERQRRGETEEEEGLDPTKKQRRETLRYSRLFTEDFRALDSNPIGWLDQQFDIVYRTVPVGQELDSPLMAAVQERIQYALNYIEGHADYQKFANLFNTRLNLLIFRATIGNRDMESIAGAARKLAANQLLYGFSTQDGNTGAMFNRMDDLLEDVRLDKDIGGEQRHITSETMAGLQDNLIHEQLDLASKGVGPYSSIFSQGSEGRDEAEKEIRRAVRTAYDIFVSTQRQAIIVSRGEGEVNAIERYMTDPGGAFNVFNLEAFTTKKWRLLTNADNELLRRIKLDMADTNLRADNKNIKNYTEKEREELGKRLFRDLFAAPDFFSSGWRVRAMLKQIEKVLLYKKARHKEEARLESEARNAIQADNTLTDAEKENRILAEIEAIQKNLDDLSGTRFGVKTLLDNLTAEDKAEVEQRSKNLGLFFRLKGTDLDVERHKDEIWKDENGKRHEGWDSEKARKETWGKIVQYRPEEILRLFEDKTGPLYEEAYGADDPLKGFKKAIFESEAFKSAGITDYTSFKKRYGPILRTLREEHLRGDNPDQLDISRLTDREKQEIDAAVGDGASDELINMFAAMRSTINTHKIVTKGGKDQTVIQALTKNERFADIYTRVLVVDDILAGDLQDTPEGLTSMANIWASTERGGDALVRNMSDITNAVKAGTALIGFLKHEDGEQKAKDAVEFAEATSQYNGLNNGRAKALRYTMGTFLHLSKKDYLWDVIGLNKGPLRAKISDIERIYGLSAKPISIDELRDQVDKIRNLLEGVQGEEKYAIITDLEELLRIRGRDRVAMGMLRALLYLFLDATGEGYKILQGSVDLKKAA